MSATFITSRYLSCGKVSVVSDCHSFILSVVHSPPPLHRALHKHAWTRSDLVNLDLTVQGPLPPDIFKPVRYVAHTVSKWVVGFPLIRLLVSWVWWKVLVLWKNGFNTHFLARLSTLYHNRLLKMKMYFEFTISDDLCIRVGLIFK